VSIAVSRASEPGALPLLAVLETHGLKKLFGEVQAVAGVDLSTKEGEFLVLLGPSGCGKTTLLRLIAGLEQPTLGDVLINGQVVTLLPPRARNIAMVFQSYALYPHLSVRDNIAFPLKSRGVKREVREQKVQWAASMLEIERLLHRKPREISGGERQRVALARALVREPVLFLFDEPLSNLDAKIRALAREELRQFQKRTGITTVYVTHDQIEAMGLGDRIAVMNRGKVQQLGTPQELYTEPADTFVATFVGVPPMNLVDRGDVWVGFRPEHCLPKGALLSHDHLVTFPIAVSRLEFLGSEWWAYGVLQDNAGGAKVVARLSGEAAGQVQAGQAQDFVVPAKELRFFDKATGLKTKPRPLELPDRAAWPNQ
jgi:multiple sugar transport system ATP-binding protein